MSARPAARWKRAACPALARIPSPNRRFGEGTGDSDLTSEGFGSRSLNRRGGAGRALRSFRSLANIGVLRAGRAQPLYLLTPPGRFALRATAHRADASLRCLRTTQRGGATPKMVAVGRSGPCPQLIRYRPARFKMRMRGLSRASGASQASAARNARNPRASVSSALEAQETRLASPTGSQGHSPVRPSAAAGAPAPPAQAPGTSHRTPRAQAFRVSEGHKKRVSPHPPSQAPRSHPPRTTRQRFGEPQLSKLKSESSDMRGGFGSLASARQPYAGRRPAKSTAQPLTK